MRILYIDIDCLRPDHLGCYGYARATSPHIDRVAAAGVRYDACYVSDSPCLPSRSALFSGRFGIHTGVVNHGGTAADMFVEGPSRGFGSKLNRTSWMRCLRDLGLHTATISPFGERHSAWHFYANMSEVHNPGRRGLEIGDEIGGLALDWLARRGGDDDWFLHVNLWDPHTPYRTPLDVGEPFAEAPLPAWLTEAVRARHWDGCGPHSAREAIGYTDAPPAEVAWDYPRQPLAIDSMDAVRHMFDGYDTGVWYADRIVGAILDQLDDLGIADEVAVLISADHGESLGELNVYGDHQFADETTNRVPFILRWPGVTDDQAGRVDRGLCYQLDVAATVVELAGGTVPDNWDGASFAAAVRAGEDGGRSHLVLSQAAWTCQRAVRFRDDDAEWLCIRTYHDGHHLIPEVMLFDVAADPHEQRDLAGQRPTLVDRAGNLLASWHARAMHTATHPIDPMWTVLAEGGPKHTRGQLPAYLERLRATGRARLADVLASRHPGELAG